MKYSKRFDEDWEFYVKNKQRLTFYGGNDVLNENENGKAVTSKEFFHRYDSQGVKGVAGLKCENLAEVNEVLRFKKSLNWHIKNWAEGYEDCLQGVDEYLEILDSPPNWVRNALIGQILTSRKTRVESNASSEARK